MKSITCTLTVADRDEEFVHNCIELLRPMVVDLRVHKTADIPIEVPAGATAYRITEVYPPEKPMAGFEAPEGPL